MTILSQGAEAILTLSGDRVIKQRPKKSYRIDNIDTHLRKTRTRREAKVLEKLNEHHIPAPKLLDVNDKDMRIEMTYLDGQKVRDVLDNSPELADQIGTLVAHLHNANIIHGDLTTSNLILVHDTVHLIDFGLSFFSHKVEDMAVDLNVLYRTIESTHNSMLVTLWQRVLDNYTKQATQAKDVLTRLEKVQARGRNKNK